MASIADIRHHMRVVSQTLQITKAMQMISTSKMKKGLARYDANAIYLKEVRQTIKDVLMHAEGQSHRYLQAPEGNRAAHIIIAADKGLAGGYNSNVLKQADAQEGPVTVLPIGKRSAEYFAHHEADLFTDEVLLAAEISVGECFSLSRKITEGFLKGDYDAVKICYTRFDSMMTQTASTMEVLPLSIEPTEQQKAEARRSQILYKPSSEEVFRAIIPEYVAGIVYGAVCESVASELAARRTAMDAATKNAGEMIEHLNLYYNRARQAAITQEITEIVAGATDWEYPKSRILR